jgi:hypothetical protein
LTGLEQPDSLKPGEVCLVSVDRDRASLWLWTESWKGLVSRQLIEDAEQSEVMVWRHASRQVPFITIPHLLRRRPSCRALAIASRGAGTEEYALKGTSFGLALGIAAASQLLGAPAPADVVALAALGESGETARVDSRGLEWKLLALREYALGVRRIMVHPSQEAEVRQHWPNMTVVNVRTLREAIAALWPEPSEAARARWQDTETAYAANEQLYRMALENSPSIVGWSPVASSAALLRELLAKDAVSARKARFTEEVAKRHMGLIARPLTWSVDEGHRELPHPDWLQTLAHDVQSWPDSGATAEECVAAAEGAMKEIAPLDRRNPPDLKLLGAIGRALAAAGQTARAVEVLREAISGWRQLRRPDDASYPICELVRVLAINAIRSELELAVERDVAWARRSDMEISDASTAFMALAVGRAFITVGDTARGMAELSGDAARWDQALPHVRMARLRWMARGYALLRMKDEATQRRVQLEEAGAADDADPNVDLARLDVALESGTDPEPIILRLMNGPDGREFQRLEAEMRRSCHEVTPVGLARYFADRYRY